jgi:hypothetical protein
VSRVRRGIGSVVMSAKACIFPTQCAGEGVGIAADGPLPGIFLQQRLGAGEVPRLIDVEEGVDAQNTERP